MERILVQNISAALDPSGEYHISDIRGRIFLETDIGTSKVRSALSHVFGVKSFSPAEKFSFTSLDDLLGRIYSVNEGKVKNRTFAVRCRRSGTHSFTSLDVERLAGELLLPVSAGVSLKSPEIEVDVEIRDRTAYLFNEVFDGPGGLPLSSQGNLAALMSGGIDSPVAVWYMMKRGAVVSPVFCSLAHPVDTLSFLDSVEKLFGNWLIGADADIFIVDGRKLIEYSVTGKGLKYPNVTFKRIIYGVARLISRDKSYHGIVTGESLGQVSSQTASNLEALSAAMDIPVYRPLIGFDKDEIVKVARNIGTFPENDPGEFCSLFSSHPAIAVTATELQNDGVPDDLIREMTENVTVVNYRNLASYRKSLIGEDLKAHSVDSHAVVVDMRNREDFQRYHYPGAVNIKLSEIAEFADSVSKGQSVLLYCKKGLQSAYAASMLRDRGISAYYTDEKILKKK